MWNSNATIISGSLIIGSLIIGSLIIGSLIIMIYFLALILLIGSLNRIFKIFKRKTKKINYK